MPSLFSNLLTNNRIIEFFLRGLSCLMICVLCACQGAPKSSDLRDRVRKVVLDNGMTFLMLDRGLAPVFSSQLKVRVGSVEDEPGQTGLAHFFEHMAFKGTDKIGTKDFAAEQVILDQVIAVGTKIAEARKAGKPQREIDALIAQRKKLESDENKLISKNEYVSLFQRNGGADLNASTSNDFTTYYVSLPANKMEMWAYAESERLKTRVFREFFTEVDVVAEERRMRIDSVPDGRLYEAYMAKAFDKSPYHVHPVGLATDIVDYTPDEAMAFYKRYYVPSRMVVALVGHFDLDEAERIVRRYFSTLPKAEDRPKVVAQDKVDSSYPRSVTLPGDGPARFYLGYHRPAYPDASDSTFDVLQELLCGGRTSRLYKRLILTDKSAASISCYASIPGARLDGMFTFYATPLPGHSSADVKAAIIDELNKMAATGPDEEELRVVKNKSDADLVYSLKTNDGVAGALAFYESLTGDWRYLYESHDRIQKMTTDEIKHIAKEYFVPSREVAAYLEALK